MKFFPLLLFIIIGHSAWGQKKQTDADKLNYCNCDSIYKWPPKPGKNNDGPEFTGNGWSRLYNFRNEIGQCGYFKDFNFMYGLQFRYDPNGNLIAINKFYKGKRLGTCDLKKK